MAGDVIEFTPETVKKYIDNAIRFWRKERTHTRQENKILECLIYVEVFQAVRLSLFGEELPIQRIEDVAVEGALHASLHRKLSNESDSSGTEPGSGSTKQADG